MLEPHVSHPNKLHSLVHVLISTKVIIGAIEETRSLIRYREPRFHTNSLDITFDSRVINIYVESRSLKLQLCTYDRLKL